LFTGLIEEVGKVVSLRRSSAGARLAVQCRAPLSVGDSVAVNGVCQTVVSLEGAGFSCDILPETLRVTNLGGLKPGGRVNIERALSAGGRFGGHMVSGHIDGVGSVKKVKRSPYLVGIEVDGDIFKYLVPKGSVAVDGISLTVGPEPEGGYFEVFIIPHTWENTNLGSVSPGSKVNIEVDILAKYVRRFVEDQQL